MKRPITCRQLPSQPALPSQQGGRRKAPGARGRCKKHQVPAVLQRHVLCARSVEGVRCRQLPSRPALLGRKGKGPVQGLGSTPGSAAQAAGSASSVAPVCVEYGGSVNNVGQRKPCPYIIQAVHNVPHLPQSVPHTWILAHALNARLLVPKCLRTLANIFCSFLSASFMLLPMRDRTSDAEQPGWKHTSLASRPTCAG